MTRGANHSLAVLDRLMLPLMIQLNLQRGVQARIIFARPFFAKTVTFFAPTVRAVKRKLSGIQLLKRRTTVRATKLRTEHLPRVLGVQQHSRALPNLQSGFDNFPQLRKVPGFTDQHLDGVLLKSLQLWKIL